jgi:flagella basal body P-ring formation protein FlgA
MAKSNISRGQVLTAELLENVRRPVDNRQIQYASFEQSVGRTATQNIQPYSLIQAPFLQETDETSPVAVKRNDLVTAIINSGTIRVQLRNAIVLENGHVGDVIQIKNPQSNRVLKGRILDQSTVEISH